MADVEVMYNDAQKRQTDQLLEELTALPAAIPTSEELMNEQSIDGGEGEQGDYSQWLANPVTKAMTAHLTNECLSLNQLSNLPNPVNIGSGELPTGKVSGLMSVLDYKSLQTVICKKDSNDE